VCSSIIAAWSRSPTPLAAEVDRGVAVVVIVGSVGDFTVCAADRGQGFERGGQLDEGAVDAETSLTAQPFEDGFGGGLVEEPAWAAAFIFSAERT